METSINQNATESKVVHLTQEVAIAKGREEERKNRIRKRRLVVALAWIATVLVVCFLVLFIASRIGGFESMGDMFYFINQHFVYSELFRLT